MATKKPKVPITAPEPDTKPSPKAGGKPKKPITAPKPDPETKPALKPEPGKSSAPANKPGPKSGAPANKPGPKSSGQDLKKGKLPPYQQRPKRHIEVVHGGPRGSGSAPNRNAPNPDTKKREICRKSLINKCTYGAKCRYFHPNEEGGNREVSWLTFCHDYRMGLCSRKNCSYFHISRHDEEVFRNTGEISPPLVEDAIQKAVKGNLTLIGTAPCCKNFLRGACNVPDCTYRHINRKEYEFEVFDALRDELEYMTGGPPPFPGQPGPVGPIEPFNRPIEPFESMPDPMQDPMHHPGPSMPMYHDDRMPMEEIHGGPPHYSDFEPQPKRPRYHLDGLDYPMDDLRDVRQGGGVWDNRDNIDHIIGMDEMRQEIINLRNDNIDLRREAEAKIADLKVDLNRATAENSRLLSEIMEKDTAIKALTATNTTLVEDRQRGQDVVHQLEQSNEEMRRALEMSIKSASAEQGKVDMLHKELVMVKNSLAKSDALIKKTGDENRRLTAELVEARNKIQELHAAQQLGFANRDVPPDRRWNEPQLPGYGDRDRSDPGWNRHDSSPWEQRKLPDGGPWEGREQLDKGPWNQRDQPDKGPWNKHNQRDRDQGAYNSWRGHLGGPDYARRDLNPHDPNAKKQQQQQQQKRRSGKGGPGGPGGPGKWSPPPNQNTPMQQIVNQMGRNPFSNNSVPWKYD